MSPPLPTPPAQPLERRYRLVELQKEELKVQTKCDDFPMWGAPALDEVGYQRKEKLQRLTAHSQRGSIFWALVERTPAHERGVFGRDDDVSDADIVAASDTIICHCESHMQDCVFRQRDGTIVLGFSHHIGSVFTLPAYRGQGLGRFFLQSVQTRMKKLPQAIGSVLYSDIGPTYYDKLGWRLHPSTHVELFLSSSLNAQAATDTEESDKAAAIMMTKLFVDDALDDFLSGDNARLVEEMAADKYKGKEVFATLLSRDSVQWQFCLGVLYAQIRGFHEKPTQCGVTVDADAFLVWCHNLKESTLYVVHARFPVGRPSVAVQLLRAAITEAHKFKLESVTIWDPSDALFDEAVAKELTIVKQDREDSLSSLIVFNQSRGENVAKNQEELLPVWLNNGKHAWC